MGPPGARRVLCGLCCQPRSPTDLTPGYEPSHPRSKHTLVAKLSGSGGGGVLQGRGRRGASLRLYAKLDRSEPLSAHRSHEEIRHDVRSLASAGVEEGARVLSAPSVIEEVLHRRDWERSSKDLTVRSPLCSQHNVQNATKAKKSDLELKTEVTDSDAPNTISGTTETQFYIGDGTKQDKHSLNETLRSHRNENMVPRTSMSRGEHHDCSEDFRMVYPALSVEPADYESSACYLSEGERGGDVVRGAGAAGRGRLASDGDILGSAHRPESGAFSESAIELEARPLTVGRETAI